MSLLRPSSVVLSVLCLLLSGTLRADEDLDFFEKKIRPVLVEHCYQCHSAEAKKVRGGLLLDSRDAIRKGGESGPGIVPNDPVESLVLDAIRYESFEMPPSGKLPDHVIGDFEKWIAAGAADPRERETPTTEPVGIDIGAGKEFWCFRPLAFSSPPAVTDRDWPESDIDAFLLSRIEEAGLHPVDDADRATLIRRATLALIGLPPRPEEIQRFENDPTPTSVAFAKLVDRLLESKHFGERWGRHWLDVVRFAESSGGGRTLLFPDAWRYRDYVIDAFNDDMPYDQFLREQVAGDLLPHDDWQSRRRQLTATAFLLLGPTNYELQDKDVLELDIVDEQIDTLGKAFLGMTIGCARCHDHKFDPIPMRDYYAMAGIFKSTRSVIHSNVSAWNKVNLPVGDELEAKLSAHEKKLAELNKRLKRAQGKAKSDATPGSFELDSLPGVVVDDSAAVRTGEWKHSTSVKGYVGAGYIHEDGRRNEPHSVRFEAKLDRGEYEVRVAYTAGSNRSKRVVVKVEHADGETQRRVNQRQKPKLGAFVSLGRFSFDDRGVVTVTNVDAADGVVIADAVQFLRPGEVQAEAPKTDTDSDGKEEARLALVKKLEAEIKKLNALGLKRPVTMAPVEEPETGDIHLAIRGVAANKGPKIPRGFLQVASAEPFPAIPEKTSGRLQLADWLVDLDNPLTARMMVNRVWYWLFGEGLVRTVDNFGSTGEQPSHPELLDYLAGEFIRDGWSVKRLVRRIMLSHVYRLSSDRDVKLEAIDPDNRLLAKMNRRRLDAESIRDSLLQIAGTLDLKIGGPNIKNGTKIEYDYVFDSNRRSVYLPVFRNTLPQLFAAFDFADPNIQGGKRTTSTIAPQALLLMNSPSVVEQTRRAAERLLADIESDTTSRVEYTYRQVLGRQPNERELKIANQFIGDSGSNVDRWSLLYQTLFQSLDFRYAR